MFKSFFPMPRLFFASAIGWVAVAVIGWYAGAEALLAHLGLTTATASSPAIGLSYFWSSDFPAFYLYVALAAAVFFGVWQYFAPHRWSRWSILGSCLILFTTYFQVQVSVAINNWYGPFYDLVQAALSKSRPVRDRRFLRLAADFCRHRVRGGHRLRPVAASSSATSSSAGAPR